MDAVCVLSMSFATCNINVVFLILMCNIHLLYTICYSLISEGNWDFPSRSIRNDAKMLEIHKYIISRLFLTVGERGVRSFWTLPQIIQQQKFV